MFKIIHDLSALSGADREQYCRDFASYLGLNPDENRIDTIWMNDNNVRSLVAYCRRGTTDILRDIHNIDVTDMVKEDGPGYVSFKASGINRRGRKEIAVGAFATTGCTGDRLAAAVATAETRAGRRLTLKFVGGGLLDESEVSNTVITESTPVAAPAIQPEAKPNSEVGKLANLPACVPTAGFAAVPNLKANYVLDKLSDQLRKCITDGCNNPVKPGFVFCGNCDVPATPLIGVTVPGAVQDRLEQVGMSVAASVEAANAIIQEGIYSETVPVKKTRKPRKSKNTVDMGDITPGLEAGKDCIADLKSPVLVKVPYEPVSCGTETVVLPVSAPVPPPKAISILTDIEQKQVKARLAPFWLDILPKGGMTADDGISIWGKLIKFANAYFPDTQDYKQWTFDKWESFFEFLDEYNAMNGATALVAYINGKINAV